MSQYAPISSTALNGAVKAIFNRPEPAKRPKCRARGGVFLKSAAVSGRFARDCVFWPDKGQSRAHFAPVALTGRIWHSSARCRRIAAANLKGCGCSSVVEHDLAKVGVEGSNPF